MCRLFGLHAVTDVYSATFWLLDAPSSLAHQSPRQPRRVRASPPTAPRARPASSPALCAPRGTRSSPERRARTPRRTFLAHVRDADTGGISERQHTTRSRSTAGCSPTTASSARLGSTSPAPTVPASPASTDSERVFALITQVIERARRRHPAPGSSPPRPSSRERAELYSINFLLATPEELWALRYPEHNELFVLERSAERPARRAPARRVQRLRHPSRALTGGRRPFGRRRRGREPMRTRTRVGSRSRRASSSASAPTSPSRAS